MSGENTPVDIFGIGDAEVKLRLEMLRSLVSQPVPDEDPGPSLVGDGLYVGNKYHASNVDQLLNLGVTAVLNCASSGIRNLPLDKYQANRIKYVFTNVAEDHSSYPILHRRDGATSPHLETAMALYAAVREKGGKLLFFCVAGQNRSATLAVAVQVTAGLSLRHVLETCSKSRPFILENVGFQQQLVELEALHVRRGGKPPSLPIGRPAKLARFGSSADQLNVMETLVEVLLPGFCTLNVPIAAECTIDSLREVLFEAANFHLSSEASCVIDESWLVFSMFGLGPEFDLILEEVAVERHVQVARLHTTFGLEVVGDFGSASCRVKWNSRCRFRMFIFSTVKNCSAQRQAFTFRHQERTGAPGTLLAESTADPYLRAWDFTTGAAFRSTDSIVFSYSENPRDKRDFMNISTSREGERVQFNAPGEGGILGMGSNAIVHHVTLELASRDDPQELPSSVLPPRLLRAQSASDLSHDTRWDAAVKRPFSLAKMLAAMENKSEAGVAKRLRMAGALNRQGRLLSFYGLGIALASNNNNHEEYKFEAVLLSQYLEDFSSYTMKRFMDDYITVPSRVRECDRLRIEALQTNFSLIQVKVLLVSLLNGFRDLTLMGVQAFDFNHLHNVLISRDYRNVRLIDIDGASKGSIQFPSSYMGTACSGVSPEELQRPALDIDLSALLPLVVQQLLLGKGRGQPFVDEQLSRIRRAKSEDDAKVLIRALITENFFPERVGASAGNGSASDRHISKLVEWSFAVLLKRSPWFTWTKDIYDAMRCIDHLPIG